MLDPHRVISIVASGGVGKTRLAQTVAGELRDTYPDGVWWVELAALSDGQLACPEVARVLGFPLPSGVSALQAVVDVLRPQTLLLLLDNCGHLLKAVGPLVEAIPRAARGVRVLLTSQEPLKIEGEQGLALGTPAGPRDP